MITLTIYLFEGFHNDTVIIRIDGREVVEKKGVNSTGQAPATKLRLSIKKGVKDILICVPSRGIEEGFPIELEQDGNLVVSINRDGKIEHLTPPDPLGFG